MFVSDNKGARDPRVLVAEDPAHHLGRDAGLETQRGEGVPQVVEPDRDPKSHGWYAFH